MADAQVETEAHVDDVTRDADASAVGTGGTGQPAAVLPTAQSAEDAPSRESIAHLAHELRTPLSAIVTSAELMAEERFGPLGDPRYKSYVEGIESSARHLLDVIELMLAGAPMPAPRAGTDLAVIAVAAIEHVRTLAEASRGTITLDIAQGLRVAAAPTALRQMLINLLANALNHAGTQPAIVVRSGRDTRGTIWIEVEDDGPGISPSLAARLLAQGAAGSANGGASSEARASWPKGHGLGLAITKSLARDNGGELSLHQVAPHGTRARLTFSGVAAE